MTRPEFPLVWDSTMLSTGRSCPQKLYRMYLEHWKPSTESVHLVAGGAFAAGLERARLAFYRDGRPSIEAQALGIETLWQRYGTFQCPEDEAKDADRMAGALEFYFDQYPLGADGATPHLFGETRGVEFGFAEPLPVRHPVTGDPLIFAGRADMVADSFGGLFLYDEKTTKQLGPSWGNQWDMRSQFTGYCWGLRGYGYQPTGIVVRGVSILKGGYDTKQVITYRSAYEVDRWLAQTIRDLEQFKLMWQEGYWDYNLDHACTEYGGCALTRVCKSADPETWLPMYFHKRVWDPIRREEIAA